MSDDVKRIRVHFNYKSGRQVTVVCDEGSEIEFAIDHEGVFTRLTWTLHRPSINPHAINMAALESIWSEEA